MFLNYTHSLVYLEENRGGSTANGLQNRPEIRATSKMESNLSQYKLSGLFCNPLFINILIYISCVRGDWSPSILRIWLSWQNVV